MLIAWILRSIEPRLALSVPYFEEAKPLWDYLAKRFSVANGPRLQQLRVDIMHCRQTKELLHQFQVGIDDEFYGIVCSNLLSRLPLPSLDEAYTVLSQDVDSKALARDKEISSSLPVHSFSIQAAPTPAAPYLDRAERAKLMCTHCRQRGHDTTTCFKIHDYPDWWEERNKKGKSATRTAPVRGRRQDYFRR
ncbi:hypothetical protein LIER_24358 [Lithospermum erythrorhizon]|uniref:Retrotransposon gag domain-containing protein n=1 Tax=Lithospermum erythrorhizon TaxID=34254 RepID=A0AAV3R2A8_LITER